MKNIPGRIINLGITPDMSFEEARKVKMLNYVCIIGWLCIFSFLIINLIKKSPPIFFLTNGTGQFVFLFTLFLNYRRAHKAARLFSNIGFLIFINLLSISFGKESGAHYINLILCVSPLVFFDKSRNIIALSAGSFLCFIGCQVYFNYLPPLLGNKNAVVFNYVHISIVFVTLFLIVWRFKTELMEYSGLIGEQHKLISQRNKDITDSISYASRIQRNMLRFDGRIQASLPDAFILFKPKDIVSGDFYWFAERGKYLFGAVADCTGHGVPGALMSMIGTTLLNSIVMENKISRADDVLLLLREGVINLLKQNEKEMSMKDGMDIGLLIFDRENRKLQFAGANNPLYLIRKNKLIVYKPDKQPVGIYSGRPVPFTNHTVEVEPGDCIYLFSDGFADQFGGPHGKKFKYRKFQEVLLGTCQLPMAEQKTILNNTIEEWRGGLEQVDDMLVVGIRFRGDEKKYQDDHVPS